MCNWILLSTFLPVSFFGLMRFIQISAKMNSFLNKYFVKAEMKWTDLVIHGCQSFGCALNIKTTWLHNAIGQPLIC
jgi:hypothetical protein